MASKSARSTAGKRFCDLSTNQRIEESATSSNLGITSKAFSANLASKLLFARTRKSLLCNGSTTSTCWSSGSAGVGLLWLQPLRYVTQRWWSISLWNSVPSKSLLSCKVAHKQLTCGFRCSQHNEQEDWFLALCTDLNNVTFKLLAYPWHRLQAQIKRPHVQSYQILRSNDQHECHDQWEISESCALFTLYHHDDSVDGRYCYIWDNIHVCKWLELRLTGCRIWELNFDLANWKKNNALTRWRIFDIRSIVL